MSSPAQSAKLSVILIMLLRGPLDRTVDAKRWHDLLNLEHQVRDYLSVLGLDLVINEAEGYAFARQRQEQEDADELPKLVRRRSLTYEVSLVLALLRKRLADHETTSGERLIVTVQSLVEMVRVFLPATDDERKILRDVRKPLREIVDLGFIRELKDRADEYEVLRILKAYVDAQWLSDFSQRLASYQQHAMAKQNEVEDE